MLTVLLGGVRSGKSALAVDLARRSGGAVTYVATCPRLDGDAELTARISRHRAERPQEWVTIEEEIDLAGALGRAATPFVVVDCLTTWVGNMVVHARALDEVLTASDAALAAVAGLGAHVVVVSNEVGSGIIPADEVSRAYGDVLGRVNQRWVARSDRALLMVAGRAVVLRDPAEV